MGRPTKFNADRAKRVIKAIADGCYVDLACASAGVDRTSYYRWMKRANAKGPENKPYRDFRRAVNAAKASAEQKCIKVILQSSHRNWQAAAWYLERTNHERWGRKLPKIDVAGESLTLADVVKHLVSANQAYDQNAKRDA